MFITIKLNGNLRAESQGNYSRTEIRLEVQAGSTVADLLVQLQIPENKGAVVFQNHQIKKKSDILEESDEIQVMQPLDGG